ncbi:Transposase [Gimesia panareensis]|uniref:Transposase n=1 Tax=Gimesia panareensis TaxID=2527978 RepID=A0A517Q416_9PLAN|nr:Transposase [Gimesia panareensis]
MIRFDQKKDVDSKTLCLSTIPLCERSQKEQGKIGITEQTFYRWKYKYAGMGVAEVRRLKQLEEENRKLKQLVADLRLDKSMLQDVLKNNL